MTSSTTEERIAITRSVGIWAHLNSCGRNLDNTYQESHLKSFNYLVLVIEVIWYLHIGEKSNILVNPNNISAHFEVAWCWFSHMGSVGLGANWLGNMSCFSGSLTLVLISWKLCGMKHESWNLNLKTYHPLKHVKYQRVIWHAFQCLDGSSSRNMSLSKHVMF
jgi:hypothetical protein